MAFGLGTLKLAPAHFWSLTPLELAAALDGVYGPRRQEAPPGRADLVRLMARFPDHSPSAPARNDRSL